MAFIKEKVYECRFPNCECHPSFNCQKIITMNNKQEQLERNATYRWVKASEFPFEDGKYYWANINDGLHDDYFCEVHLIGPMDKNPSLTGARTGFHFKDKGHWEQIFIQQKLPSIETVDYEKEALKMVKEQSDSDFRNSGSFGGTARGIDRIPFVVMPAIAKLMVNFYQSMPLKQPTEETKPIISAEDIYMFHFSEAAHSEDERNTIIYAMKYFSNQFRSIHNPSLSPSQSIYLKLVEVMGCMTKDEIDRLEA